MRIILTLLLFLATSTTFSQLPEKWMGRYAGELKAVNLVGQESSFGMELIISEKKDSTYGFTIIYTKGEVHQERAYVLKPTGINTFVLDEQNGIELDMSLGNDRLVSVFEVQGGFLHVSYILTKKGIRYELTTSAIAEKSGGTTTDSGEEIPEVQSYKTSAFQFATLKRQKK